MQAGDTKRPLVITKRSCETTSTQSRVLPTALLAPLRPGRTGAWINLARRYVETTDKIRQLGAHLRLLETAKELATEWQDRL